MIKDRQPERSDFLSDEARGRRPRGNSPEALRRHRGFSVWTSEERARTMAKHFPSLGAYVAELEPPPGAALEPFAEAVDHQTAYGDADAFARSVVRVVPVG